MKPNLKLFINLQIKFPTRHQRPLVIQYSVNNFCILSYFDLFRHFPPAPRHPPKTLQKKGLLPSHGNVQYIIQIIGHFSKLARYEKEVNYRLLSSSIPLSRGISSVNLKKSFQSRILMTSKSSQMIFKCYQSFIFIFFAQKPLN